MTLDSNQPIPAAMWKRTYATFSDLLTSFFASGYLVGLATGNTTSSGFKLEGGPALALLSLAIAYFVIGHLAGGTLWDLILGLARPQPQ